MNEASARDFRSAAQRAGTHWEKGCAPESCRAKRHPIERAEREEKVSEIELFNWSFLGNYGGAVLAVAVLTQISKEIPGVKRIPTQLWSYLLATATLLLALIFGPGFSVSEAVLVPFNAALVSLAANGGYAAVERVRSGLNRTGKEE